MRVAVAAHRLAVANPTGVDRYVTELVGALARQPRISVTVGSAAERDTPSWLPEGVAVRHARGPRPLITLSWCLSGRPRVDRAFDHPDLVHVAVPAYPIPARVPVVHSIFDLFPLHHPSWFSRKERFGFRRALDAALAAPAIVVASTTVATDLAALGADPGKIVMIPLGIADEFFAAGRVTAAYDSTNAYDLFVGAVNERKHVDVLVRALSVAPEPRPLVLAGPPGPGVDAVRELAAQLGVEALLRPVGFVPDADLPALMAGARALVQPSRDEGFGFTPLEAMATGTPAVVARAGSLSEVVGDAAVVVDDPDDPRAWAAALAHLDDPRTRSIRSEHGRARAADFSWISTAERTVAVWDAVLDGRGPSGA